MLFKSLRTFDEFRQVMALETEIWGYSDPEDAVGIPMFVITLKRGGILLGAYDGDRMVGFVYSIAGIKAGRATQWSHMLGVLPAYRGTGLGRDLKLEQRRIALEMGLDLMEWTYDPLQAVNAHLNFKRLGVVVEDYVENVYGESSSILHRGNPTDRFIAQWWMRSARVTSLVGEPARAGAPGPDRLTAWPADVAAANTVAEHGTFIQCDGVTFGLDVPHLAVTIPAGFTDMIDREPGLARAWRQATREIFERYLGRGYRVIDFEFGPGPKQGRYLLSNLAH